MPAMINATEALLAELREVSGREHVVTEGNSLEALSKDFYWYSPVLRRQLDFKQADAVVSPGSLAELRAIVAACHKAGAPVVARGAGTGNYGQCVPLYGGVVVDFSRLDRILSMDNGIVRVEPGARLGMVEAAARDAGWEMRCMPSTWVKSTMGGFLSGGSGGIGSITWGGIHSPGNVKSLTLLTCEAEPRLIRLEEEQSLKALHTYGTTGLLVEIEVRLAPKVEYDQLIFSSPDWDKLLDWMDSAARRGSWRKRLASQFQWPVPSFFRPLLNHLHTGEHASFLLLERAQAGEAVRGAEAAGIACVYRRPLSDPPRPPFITDFTWNHTTLWAIQSDPTYTYLQAGFGPDFRGQFAELGRRFPGELLLHLEWTVNNAKMMRAENSPPSPDGILVGGIPLVRFESEARLAEIRRCCAEIGVFIANPHTFYLEDGSRHANIAEKRALKGEVDPKGLLNPGKKREDRSASTPLRNPRELRTHRRLSHLGKSFDGETPVLEDISLEAGRNEFVSFIGPSGCGKSTLLRLIAGLTPHSSGEIVVDEKSPEGARAGVFVVFQDPNLLPWRRVAANVELPLRLRGDSRASRRQRVAEMLDLVGLSAEAHKFPWQLSGGMRMRVSIARALSVAPSICCSTSRSGRWTR